MTAIPQSLEAEASVLGAVLVHPRRFVDVAPLVRAEDFYHPAHRAIFEALVELDAGAKPIDCLTVMEQLRGLGTLDKLNSGGGAAYLTDLMARVVATETVAYHARMVRAKADRRRLFEAAHALVELAADEDTADDDAMAAAEVKLLELQRGEADAKPERLEHVLYRSLADIERRYTNRDRPGALGITTGFVKLDEMTCGLQPGELWVIGARPSMGKSALAGAMVQAASAAQPPYPCLFFSLEMVGEQLGERMIAADSSVALQGLRTGRLSVDDLKAVTRVGNGLSSRPVWIHPKRTLNIAEIRSIARRWRLGDGCSPRPCVVVVDYLGLIASMARGVEAQDRQHEIAAMSRGLKLLAGELGGAVVALAQLNRKCEERGDKRPVLSDLRDSGAIEQDADVIAFIYRDHVYNPNKADPGDAEVIIAKQRNGPTGTACLRWVGQLGKFMNKEGA